MPRLFLGQASCHAEHSSLLAWGNRLYHAPAGDVLPWLWPSSGTLMELSGAVLEKTMTSSSNTSEHLARVSKNPDMATKADGNSGGNLRGHFEGFDSRRYLTKEMAESRQESRNTHQDGSQHRKAWAQ